MSIQVVGEAKVMREASEILLEHLTPSEAARFWASWHVGKGDYLAWRDEEFANETVTTLYEKIQEYQWQTCNP